MDNMVLQTGKTGDEEEVASKSTGRWSLGH